MKIKICFLVLFILLNNNQIYSKDIKWIGIIKNPANKIFLKPDFKKLAGIKKKFGSVVLLKNRYKTPGSNHIWFQDKMLNLWYSKDDLILVRYNFSNVKSFTEKSIYCNKYCGVKNEFSPIIIGDYYIHKFVEGVQAVICKKNNPEIGVAIGKVKMLKDQIIFYYPKYFGSFYCVSSYNEKNGLIKNFYFSNKNFQQDCKLNPFCTISKKIIFRKNFNKIKKYFIINGSILNKNIERKCRLNRIKRCTYKYYQLRKISIENLLRKSKFNY